MIIDKTPRRSKKYIFTIDFKNENDLKLVKMVSKWLSDYNKERNAVDNYYLKLRSRGAPQGYLTPPLSMAKTADVYIYKR